MGSPYERDPALFLAVGLWSAARSIMRVTSNSVRPYCTGEARALSVEESAAHALEAEYVHGERRRRLRNGRVRHNQHHLPERSGTNRRGVAHSSLICCTICEPSKFVADGAAHGNRLRAELLVSEQHAPARQRYGASHAKSIRSLSYRLSFAHACCSAPAQTATISTTNARQWLSRHRILVDVCLTMVAKCR